MKKSLFILLALLMNCFVSVSVGAVDTVRTKHTFEKGWKFTREDETVFSQTNFDDSPWQTVTVPHDWAIYGPFSVHNDQQKVAISQDGQKEAMEQDGIGWILKFLNLQRGRKLLLFLTEQ